MQLLYKARKRHGFVLLYYIVTSNHIHLIVYEKDSRETIREPQPPYNAVFDAEKSDIDGQNLGFWNA